MSTLRYSREDLRSDSHLSFVHPEDHEAAVAKAEQMAELRLQSCGEQNTPLLSNKSGAHRI
ncbi:MAG: hypothetical protein ACI841_005073 [Planctomycetota bacterium]|jgi:hypothetical protein